MKVQSPNTHTKEVKSQGLLLTNPRKGGRRSSDLGEREFSIPGHRHGGRKQGGKPLDLEGGLGQRSLILAGGMGG